MTRTDHDGPHTPPHTTFRALFWLVAGLLCLGLTHPLANAEELDSIVAIVNDDVVVQSEVSREMAQTIPQLQEQGTPVPPPEQLRKQVLERLILKRLQQQRAKQLGITVDEAALTSAIQSIASRNNLSIEELQATLESSGMRFEAFREDTRMQILTGRLQNQEVVGTIQVSDQEVERFLQRDKGQLMPREQVRLQHILIALPDNPSPAQIAQAEAKAKQLIARLRGGADFAAVAAASSEGRTALQGGDLGWFEMAAVPSLVADKAQTMAQGEITDPIRSPSGFNIIRLAEIKGGVPGNVTQTKARHILIRPNELVADEDARIRLAQLRMRIVGGDDFATLARAHSDDTGSALKGGDLGWVNPGQTVPEFEAAMNKLAPNEVSEPVHSSFGWHIIQVQERRSQDTADELLRLKAKEAIQRRKVDEATDAWLKRLRDEAYVELRLDAANTER
ncbi:peptidylprolyl isomerase [uncultured Lamprocystis sp.]|jgi:peptidyl-prolyl cis-trans isomerase SurA|uniref:peptidylprolyl isomerase n=1 Tax=uncultured Lamprocystis sp. TaxID=543132 RepID=UPI0025F13DC5|nr:peptidylprolyl isomerase [uncultured Lamprocystis sp.]